jgi:penicillin-binding protein 1A
VTPSKRSLSRKLKEAALSWQLDQVWSKDRILTAYLNTIYFGNGSYGIERAAQVYFGHGASKLTTAEAALLAGIPADPSRFNPVTDPKAAHQRRRDVLQAMVDQKDITYNEFRKANRTPLPKPEDIHQPGVRGPAQYFVDYVKQQLVDRYRTRKVFGGGLVVKTTIDLRCNSARGTRSRNGCTARTCRPRRSSRSTRGTGACSRWSVARTTGRASSTSRCRASASPARPSSRSC